MAEDKTASASGGLKFGKHLQLSQAQKMILIAAAVGIFVVVFTIVAAKSLMGQHSYQAKVIEAKKTALSQLKDNVKSASSLVKSYNDFETQHINALGGTSDGTGPQDGDNATLILEALPPKYDFPALASSLEKIILGQNMSIQSITGEDDQATQQDNTSSSSPKPVEMPFSVTAQGQYQDVQSMISVFEHSIRPFQIQTIELKGDQGNMTVNLTAQTYYQPAKNFKIIKRAVR